MSLGANKQALMGAAGASSAGGEFYSHQIANSVRMSDSANSTLKFTAGTPTSGKTFTYSWWWKRYNIDSTSTQSSNVFCAGTGGGTYVFWPFTNSSTPQFNGNFSGGNFGDNRLTTDMVFRDPASWYHCVLRFDSTQAATANRVRMYVNGEEPTYADASVQSAIAQDGTYSFMNQSGVVQSWGGISGVGTGGEGVDAQLAEIVMCDGQSYAPTEFGETKNGVWIPKDPSGLTFGNNGYYLKFTNSSDLGEDFSGNNNDFTVANISSHDQMLDTPTFNSDTNGGKFAAYNPLIKGSYTDLSEGNLRADSNTGADASYPAGDFGMLSGKWYYEQLIGNLNGSYPSLFLTAFNNNALSTTKGIFYAMRYRPDTGAAEQSSGDNIAPFGTITVVTTGVATAGTGDIVSWYVDMDNKKAWFAKNGTIPNSGNPATGANPQFSWTINPPGGITFGSQEYQTSYTTLNAGQDGTFAGEKTAQGNSDDTGYGNFYYDPPTGFLAMCSGNLPIADAINPSETSDDYPQKLFQAKTYTGTLTGAGVANINHDLGSAPDFIWSKTRSTGSTNNMLRDSTRGPNKTVSSNTTDLEADKSGNGDMGSTFATSTTFPTNNTDSLNVNGQTFIAWLWRANGGTTSTNTQGSEDSTVQVDPSGHFSIVKWTGTNDSWGNAITVGHGLSAAPNVMICKKYLGNADQWEVFFSDYGNYSIGGSNAACNSLRFDTDAALYTNQSYKTFGGVMPTSTAFTVDGNNLNGSGDTILAYCFADCEGYIKSGTYEGNANADGSFVYTGFKPAWIMAKPLPAGNWRIQDTTRSPYNPATAALSPNNTNAEDTVSSLGIDILSNGFKMRTSSTEFNQSTTMVFLAMSHNPLKYATAR